MANCLVGVKLAEEEEEEDEEDEEDEEEEKGLWRHFKMLSKPKAMNRSFNLNGGL